MRWPSGQSVVERVRVRLCACEMVVASAGLVVMDIKPRIISAEVKRSDHATITADVHTTKPHIAGEYNI